MRLLLACTAALVLFLAAGCDIPAVSDRPLPEALPDPEPVRVVAGPWLSSLRPDRFTVCFVTDRPAESGARLTGGGAWFTRRNSFKRRIHTLDFTGLDPGATYRCDLLVPDGDAVSASVTTLPPAGADATVAVVTGGGDLGAALAAAVARDPDAILLAGPLAGANDAETWIDEVLRPHAELLRGRTLLWAPDPSALSAEGAAALFPETASPEGYVADVGALRLAIVAPDELRDQNLFRLVPWLEEATGAAGGRVTVAALPAALALPGPGGLQSGLLERLAPVFERGRVAAALSLRAGFYHRTAPLGSGGTGVQYLALPAAGAAVAPPAPSDYTAALAPAAGACLLRVAGGRLEGRVLGPDGSAIDTFAAGPDTPPAIDRRQLVSAAWARVSQRREVRAVARQAARAVANPARPGELRFVVANPSPLPFEGTLVWRFANTAFFVEPESAQFDLQPGAAVASVFRFRPSGRDTEAMPTLFVASARGGEASQELLLTWRRSLTVPRVEGDYVIDGRPEEAWWGGAAAVEGFVLVDGQEPAEAGVRAWMAAGPMGLRVRFRCALPEGAAPTASVTAADGRVWQDESVEIFLDPDHRGRDFRQLAVNTAGVLLSADSRLGRRWNPDWEAAVEVRDGRYNVEMLIPYTSLNRPHPPARGETWGINLTRNDYTGDAVRVHQSAPTFGSNARAGCYMAVTFE